MAEEIDFERLWEIVSDHCHGDIYSVHGPAHWHRVEQNGLLLASRTKADIAIVRLFAIFHDSCRVNEGTDDGHGARGAIYAAELRGSAFELDDLSFGILQDACIWHTDQDHSADPTIGTCWDADRLDLGRVGMVPNADYMSTTFGKEIANYGSIQPFLAASPAAIPSRKLG